MEIEVKYLISQPYFIHKGYRTLIVTNRVVTYINFKNNSQKKFNINLYKYRDLFKKYKLYGFKSVLTRRICNGKTNG